MMMAKHLTIILSVTLFLFSCGCTYAQEKRKMPSSSSHSSATGPSEMKNQQSQPFDESVSLKIYVDKTGQITLNEQPTSTDQLDHKLKLLKEQNGIVFYSRDDATSAPTEQAMNVIKLIVANKLPIRLYTDRTFTQPVLVK